MSRDDRLKLNFQPLYSGSTANVFKTVELGKAAAGATLDSDLALLSPFEAGRFRTILRTPPIAPHALAAHPRVPAAAQESVTGAVLAIGADARARDLLDAVRLSDPTRADYARDYRPLEGVDLKALGRVP